MAYEVPPLPYDYNALEPTIDEETMHLHHDKHHQAYVTNANKALEGTEWADKPVEEVLQNLDQIPDDKRNAVRNNAGGHYNHSLFWEWMSPDGGGEPDGALRAAIDSAFGSFDDFKDKLKAAGVGQFGSGWAWLVHDGSGLAIVSTPNQDSPISDRQDAAAGRRRVGARLLPEVPEPPPGLHRRVVERRQLAEGGRGVRRGVLTFQGAGRETRLLVRFLDHPAGLRPGEPAPGDRRGLLVEARRRGLAAGLALRAGGLRLHRRDPLGRHRGRVLVLGQPLLGLGGGALVTDDALAGGVVLVDLGEQLVDQVLGLDLAQHLALRVDRAGVLGARDAEVGVAGLADPVHGAAEHRHLDRVLVGLEPPLDLRDHRVHVELEPAAGRARDQHGAALAQLQRLEDLPRDLDLLLGVERRQRDPDRVADPVGEQRPEADRRTSAIPTTWCRPR